MKSIVCEQPFELALKTQKKAHSSSDLDVLISIKRIGVCGTDLHAFQGNQPYFSYPRILGHELSGTIVSLPESVNDLREGDRVTIIPYLHCNECQACRNGKTNCCEALQVLGVHKDGGMQERLPVPASNVIAVNNLSFEQAALIEPFAIGAHAIRRSDIQRGHRVLVIGAGPIGLGVMRFAKAKGAHVTVVDTKEDRLDFCRRWAGVDEAFPSSNHVEEELRARLNGDLPDIVLDATGSADSMMNAFHYVAHGGTLTYVGLVKQTISFHDPDFHQKEITLKASRNATKEDFHSVINWMRTADVDVNAYITHTSTFDDAINGFSDWLATDNHVIKAIISIP
ncbi:zinc-binding alcohol dehydrogenase family protein [Shouchella shacheensis]|uniref:zinc-binding alcohol dehydrogenase family protein n=1 Tax=Shouchella shacheensis TaxID=1649580 RepID=UPI00073FF766|nr:zinc-binding alcohol dehydrogenase family protein [Shouchella shacheensis]